MISNMNNRNNMDILTRSQNIVLRRTRRRLPIIANDEYSTVVGIEQEKQQKQPEITLTNDQNASIVDQNHLKYSGERVTVQYLNNYTQLTNNHNCWNNFSHFYNQNASKNDRNINNIDEAEQDKEDEKEKKDNEVQDFNDHLMLNSISHNQTRKKLTLNDQKLLLNNYNNCNNKHNNNDNDKLFYKNSVKRKTQCPGECAYIRITSAQDNIQVDTDNGDKSNVQRTQDQEYAFRCVESVHNYAKLSPSLNSGVDDVTIDPVHCRNSSSSCSSTVTDTDIQDNADSLNYNNLDDNNNDNHSKIDNRKNDIEEERDDMEVDSDELRERMEDNSDLEYEHYFKKRYHYQQYRNHRDRYFHNHHDHNCLVNDNGDKVDNVQIEKIDRKVDQIGDSSEKNLKMANSKSTAYQHHNHHARRPMNAFLIFCKRHRSIVKERYKTLENRGITKILGEWWASLNASDKESFVKLAKQNKDAFFSANPNFKWYKLPTTHMRSTDTQADANPNGDGVSESYFKLATEAEIGEQLRGLMQTHCDMKESLALQQILGETKQFLTEQMPTVNTEQTIFQLEEAKPHLNQSEKRKTDTKSLVRNSVLNRCSSNDAFFDDNSINGDSNVSRNNDLETVPKKKYNRLCKGKIYQELINSGQLVGAAAAAVSPTTSSTTLNSRPNIYNSLEVDDSKRKVCQKQRNSCTIKSNSLNMSKICSLNKRNQCCDKYSNSTMQSDSDKHGVKTFDLEEKIKELPALDLDNYLQSKRHNTKKKRKFSMRTNSNYTRKWKSSTVKKDDAVEKVDKQSVENEGIFQTTLRFVEQTDHGERTKPQQQQQEQQPQLDLEKQPQLQKRKQPDVVVTAVGSQKRKARKESITRRDVSSIENEFLSMNGCCYLEMESPTELLMSTTPKTGLASVTTTMPTSDLLILAEVASNRTELKP